MLTKEICLSKTLGVKPLSFIDILGAFVFAFTFISISLALHYIDLQNNYFDHAGIIYPIHHILMAALGIYLFWFFYAVGDCISTAICKSSTHAHNATNLNYFILNGFLGLS